MGKSQVKAKCPKCEHVFLPSIKEKQSRAGKSARRKGHAFERRVAKQLQDWWPGDYEFKRTPQSGGSALKHGWDLAGDICTNAPDFNIHLENKNAPSSFTGLHNLFSDRSAVWKWWEQAKLDCPDNKFPMLIINRFDQPTYCFSSEAYDASLSDRLNMSNISYFIYINSGSYYVWKFDDWVASDPKVWVDI